MGDRSLDARADIYALGAMMYFALTGRPPFAGETPFAVMMAHARDPVVPPSQVRPGVPDDLEQVVLRCLAKKPGTASRPSRPWATPWPPAARRPIGARTGPTPGGPPRQSLRRPTRPPRSRQPNENEGSYFKCSLNQPIASFLGLIAGCCCRRRSA